jgi:hypothetical protein
VVSERDRVGARAPEPLCQLGRQPGAVGGVLCVDDAEVGLQLVPKSREAILERPRAGCAEDVGDEEDPYGMAKVAAGWTSMATWLPASCV